MEPTQVLHNDLIVDVDSAYELYSSVRQDVLEDPGYLIEMINALNKQRDYHKVVDED